MYYRGALAAVIVYDITNQISFEKMTQWVDELKQRASPNIVLAVAGNKKDLGAQRQVTTTQAEAYLSALEQSGLERPIFHECSAKSGEGVREIFEDVCERLIKMVNEERNGSGKK